MVRRSDENLERKEKKKKKKKVSIKQKSGARNKDGGYKIKQNFSTQKHQNKQTSML